MTQYVPQALPPMDVDEAREFVAWAKDIQDNLVKRVYEAYNRQAHLSLGYESWDAMCEGEGLGFYKLPRDKRAPAVVQLKSMGMSNRAIGSAVGVDEKTVRNDIERSTSAEKSALNDQAPIKAGGIQMPRDRAERVDRAINRANQVALLIEVIDEDIFKAQRKVVAALRKLRE